MRLKICANKVTCIYALDSPKNCSVLVVIDKGFLLSSQCTNKMLLNSQTRVVVWREHPWLACIHHAFLVEECKALVLLQLVSQDAQLVASPGWEVVDSGENLHGSMRDSCVGSCP